jgi:hypothetical protein
VVKNPDFPPRADVSHLLRQTVASNGKILLEGGCVGVGVGVGVWVWVFVCVYVCVCACVCVCGYYIDIYTHTQTHTHTHTHTHTQAPSLIGSQTRRKSFGTPGRVRPRVRRVCCPILGTNVPYKKKIWDSRTSGSTCASGMLSHIGHKCPI